MPRLFKFVPLALLAVFVCVDPSSAVASSRPSSHARTCRARSLHVTVQGHRICVDRDGVLAAARRAGFVDTRNQVAPGQIASALASFLAAHAPRSFNRRLTTVWASRLLRALAASPGLSSSAAVSSHSGPARAFRRSADALAVSAAVTTGQQTQLDPPPGQLGSGYTGVADATVAPGQTARESHTESAFATACPDASGYDPAAAEYTTRTSLSIVGDHRLRMLSDITASTRARAIGHVNETGKLKNFDVVIDVELKGDARVVGPAGLIHGNPMSTLQKMRIVYTGLDPHSYQDEEFTSAHIGQISVSGLQDGRYEFGADGSLLGSQDVGKLLAFARIPLLKLREALERAEHNFFDDARCLRAEFSPATLTVQAGSSTPASARVLSTLDGAPVSIDLQLKALASGTVSPPLVHAAPSSPARFVFTAGSKEDDDAITLAGTSRQGRVLGYLKDHTVATPTFPYYYRVLSSSYSTHADGQTMPGNYNVCESQQLHAGGSEDWKGSSGALTFSNANAVSRADSTGALSGRVWADVPTIIDSAVFGCSFDSHGAVTPCQQTFPSQNPKPNGTTTIGFSITAPSADAPSATLHWAVPDPQVGIAGGGSDPCNAPYLTQPIPYSQLDQAVPLTQLSSTQPQTYTFSGGPLHWNTDSIGQPASLNYQWQYTITIQRVNQDGTPVS